MCRILGMPRAILYLAAIFAFAFATSAQSPLNQDWTKWSSDTCTKILTASPWVTTAQPQDPKNSRRAALVSSLLVREAMLRQEQIRQKYDTMSPKKRKEFDEQNATCLGDPRYSNYIVVRVWSTMNVSVSGPPNLIVADHTTVNAFGKRAFLAALSCGAESFPWQHILTAIDKLNDDYNMHHPSPLIPPDNSQLASPPTLDFLYSRSVDGKPLIQPGDRTMVLDWGEKGGQFTFQLANLIYKDKLDF
jgi:hypothetical protein